MSMNSGTRLFLKKNYSFHYSLRQLLYQKINWIWRLGIIWVNIIQWKYLKVVLIISIAQAKSAYKFPNFRLH